MMIEDLVKQRTGQIHSCTSDSLVSDAARFLSDHRIGALPVMRSGLLIGIFSERDLLYYVAREGAAALGREVSEVMSAPAITIGPDIDVIDALRLMTSRRIRHLPVIHEGAMIGLVSIGDLVKQRVEQAEADAEAMREYIQTA